MINYKDCPECGARKIRESVRLCEVCEVSQRYEKRIGELQALLDLANTMHDVAVKERDLARRQLDRPHEPPGRTEYVVGLELNLDQMRQCIEGFVEVVEAAEAHATGPKGGQQVTFSGDFASAPPSTRGQLRWWASRLKEASNEHSSESHRPS